MCRRESTGPTGKNTELYILAYDAKAKAYTYYGISSFGENVSSKGFLTGNTRTFLSEGKAAGKPAKFRETDEQVSPTSRTFKLEYSVAGGPWTVVLEGKATKVK